MATQHPTPDELRRHFRYDPETGQIYRITGERPGPVGHKNRGYIKLSLDGCQMLAHRVAWALHHGSWPVHQIDHINGVKDDNRIANLRDVTGLVNSQNMHGPKKNSETGVLNVSQYRTGRYVARVFRNGQRVYLGSYGTAEEAAEAVAAVRPRVVQPHLGTTV